MLLSSDSLFKVVNYPTPFGRIDITFSTKYKNVWPGDPVPCYLMIDARGKAPSLENAMDAFSAAVSDLVPIVSLSANAYVDTPIVYLAYDNTAGHFEREFFQRYFKDELGHLERARRSDAQTTAALHEALFRNPASERLRRAVGQYHMGLLNWNPGHEALAIEHLFIGMEILTPVVRKRLCEQHTVNEDGLVALLRIESKKELDPKIRERFLFKGDIECYKNAKQASDSFEHGYSPFHEVRATAREVCDRTARYLRTAIFELVGLEKNTLQVLNSPPYDKPLMRGRHDRQFKALLVGEDIELAANGEIYPFMDWKSEIESVSLSECGEYEFKFTENMTARLARGVQFKPGSFCVWGPPQEFKKECST